MSALLDDLPTVDDHDPVRVGDGGQSNPETPFYQLSQTHFLSIG